MSSKADEIRARRAARELATGVLHEDQECIDLEAIDAIEVERGEALVVTRVTRWQPGVVALVAHRCPTSPEFKRFQDMAKGVGGKPGDPLGATNLIADCCLEYPSKDEYVKALAVCPGVHVSAGTAAIVKVSGRVEVESKS